MLASSASPALVARVLARLAALRASAPVAAPVPCGPVGYDFGLCASVWSDFRAGAISGIAREAALAPGRAALRAARRGRLSS